MLEAKQLTKAYRTNGRDTAAVKCTDLILEAGKTYVLVGESGSGKSTLSMMLMGLLPPTSGQVLLNGIDLASLRGAAARARFACMQMVLQDGKSALDPRFTVYKSIAEPIRNFKPLARTEERERVLSLLGQVELCPALAERRVHELSGGQQKRVCIARALAVSPQLLIFDEAVSGLDVIVRGNILELLRSLQRGLGFTCLFITHDMEVALYMADEIFVMKDGVIVEKVVYRGEQSVFWHPYSIMLLGTLLQ